MEFRDLKKQYRVLREDMDRALLGAVASGAYIMGPQVKELEKQRKFIFFMNFSMQEE